MISVSADDIREHELYIQECTVDEINGQYKIWLKERLFTESSLFFELFPF